MANVSGHPPQFADVVSLDANKTLTAADSGKVYTSGAADVVVTLPAASPTTKGVNFTFVTLTLSTTTGFSFSPVAADKIQGTGITAADDKDIINTAATDAVGDTLKLICDGIDGYLIVSKIGTYARES